MRVPAAGADPRIVAIDWSGAVTGAARKIWVAEAGRTGLVALASGRDREQTAEWILAEASRGGRLIVGLDFAFAFPAWFARAQGWRAAPDGWAALAAGAAERWLARCEPPFWGRRGTRKPAGLELHRRCERGSRAKSVFQVSGAGAVGTGSLRGMALLHRLRTAGVVIWPFTTAPGAPGRGPSATVVEIYPRLLTGPVVKSDGAARRRHLAARFPTRLGAFADAAAGSEDAFDAAVSALVMWEHRAALARLPRPRARQTRLEGAIWSPGPVRRASRP